MSEVLKVDYIGHSYQGKERRNFPRFFAQIPIRIRDPWGKDKEADIWVADKTNIFILEVNSRDISSQGVGIISSQFLQPQAQLELWLKIPDREEPLRLYGKIVWVSKFSENTWRAGVCFDTPQFKVMGKIEE